jgi:hypothetical protein
MDNQFSNDPSSATAKLESPPANPDVNGRSLQRIVRPHKNKPLYNHPLSSALFFKDGVEISGENLLEKIWIPKDELQLFLPELTSLCNE